MILPNLPQPRLWSRRLLEIIPNFKFEAALVCLMIATLLAVLFQDAFLRREITFDPSNVGAYTKYPFGDADNGGRSTARAVENSALEWTCTLRQGYDYPYCGYELLFDPIRYEEGRDFSSLQTLRMLITYQGSADTLRMNLKNFDPRYSTPGKGESTKFNGMLFPVVEGKQLVTLNLHDFRVAEWWLAAHRIPPDLGWPEFDNIISISVLTGTGAPLGAHAFKIHNLAIEGHLIAPESFYLLLLGGWVALLGAYLIYRIINLSREMAARKAAEARTEAMQVQIIHLSRLSAMGDMASSLAHELNQPLTAISNYMIGMQRLIQNGATPETLRPPLVSAGQAALRAGEIIRGLREMVGGSTSRKQEDLLQLVEQVIAIALVDAVHEGVAWKIDIPPHCRQVVVDRVQVQQVLVNLFRNAIDAMRHSPRRHLLIEAECRPDDMVEIIVSDTGSGVPEAFREELFSAFQTTKEEGMGIGLSISRTIVEAHGGRIWAEHPVGGGTVFKFTVQGSAQRGGG